MRSLRRALLFPDVELQPWIAGKYRITMMNGERISSTAACRSDTHALLRMRRGAGRGSPRPA